MIANATESAIAQGPQVESESISGTVYAYSAYGETAVLGPDGGNALRYTGREDDGGGLFYYRARYYDPVLKRFISEDPIGIEGGINLYSYVEGSPVNYSDPEGLRSPAARTTPSTRQIKRHPGLNQSPVVQPTNSLTRQEQLDLQERGKFLIDFYKEFWKQEQGMRKPGWLLPPTSPGCVLVCVRSTPGVCRPDDGCTVVCGPRVGPY